MMDKTARIFVAGHNGLLGSAIVRKLLEAGYSNIITRAHSELDLCAKGAVDAFFLETKPEFVFMAAAKVGNLSSMQENPADFLYENTMMTMNVIEAALNIGTKGLVSIGSSWIYPKGSPQPLKEDDIFSGLPEEIHIPYALPKLSALKLCEYIRKEYNKVFCTVIPTNIYGLGDCYDSGRSHAIAAMIRRFCEAKDNDEPFVLNWGDGTPLRDFIFADDLGEFMVLLMEKADEAPTIINAASGRILSIAEAAEIIATVAGYKGEIRWDASKPSGAKKALMDTKKAEKLGFFARTSFEEGIRISVNDFRERQKSVI